MRYFKRILLFIILGFFSFPAVSKDKEADSLLRLISAARNDTGKVKLLLELSSFYIRTGKAIESIQSSTEAHVLSKKLNYLDGTIRSHMSLAVAFRTKGNYPEAVKNLLSLLKLQEEKADKKGMANAYNMLGIVYNNQQNFEEALRNHEKALALRRELNLPQEIAGCYNNIGLVHYQQLRFDEAMKNFSLALVMAKNPENKKLLSSIYSNMANVFEEQNKLDEAFTYYNMANDLRDPKNMATTLNYYAKVGHLMLKKKNYSEAREYVDRSLELATNMQNKEFISFAYENLEKLSLAQKDFKSAYKYRTLYDIYKDSLLNQVNREKTLAMRIQYEFEKKAGADSLRNAQNARLEKLHHEQALHRQQMYSIGGVIGFGLMLVVALTMVRAYAQKKKANRLISKQKQMVEQKQKEILDSIQYAHRIQAALLPNEKYLGKNIERLKDS